MQINDLIIFKSVAENNSFTKAAAATNTVQSNVTARVKFLESEFNTKLFDRTSRKMELTAAGIELLKTAKEILMLIDQTKTSIGGAATTIKGQIKIGCIHTTAALRAPGILHGFVEKYPDTEFKLNTGTTASLIKDVLAHKLDGAFVAGAINDERLIVKPILKEELGIVTSSFVHSIDDLKNMSKPVKLIVFGNGCSYRKHFEHIIEGWNTSRFSIIEHDTLEGILNSVEAGIGVTLLPVELIEKHYPYKSLRVFQLPDETSGVDTVFIKRKDAVMNQAYQMFFEMITASYGANAPTS